MQPHNNKNVFLYENNKTNHLNNHKLYFIFQRWANIAPTLLNYSCICIRWPNIGPTIEISGRTGKK